nr:MAG TPA_asm: hypothetical protein [Caudoviricetes sp.]DAL55818.1 MAG TPA_asm: hypothetical protein [Caudoviricetes sp.]
MKTCWGTLLNLLTEVLQGLPYDHQRPEQLST